MTLKYVTDHFSLTGASHIPKGLGCQDYATSGTLPKGAVYAIVCDGCSCADPITHEPDRSAKTAVGASSLALITARAISKVWELNSRADEIAQLMINMQQQLVLPTIKSSLGLENKDLLATCMYVLIAPTGGIVNVQGDGVLALRKRNGEIILMRWDWSNNEPYYPCYNLDNTSSVVNSKGGVDAEVLTEQHWLLPAADNAEPIHLLDRKVTVSEGAKGVCISLNAEEVADIESLVLFSDGICSVAKGPYLRPEFLDWKDMVRRIFVRGWGEAAPDFVQARLDRWQERDVIVLDAKHLDDLSIAAIRRIYE